MMEEPNKKKKKKKQKLSASELNQRNELLKELQESGELERWKLSLYAQLMLQESWRDDLKDQTREAVQTSGGISEITLDELGETLVNYGKQSIPHSIQADLKAKIRQTVVQSSSWNETK